MDGSEFDLESIKINKLPPRCN